MTDDEFDSLVEVNDHETRETQLSYGEDRPVANEELAEGAAGMPIYYNDPSTALAVQKGYYIQIYHLISTTSIYFKAFLTDFADNFATNYNKEEVFGRTDPIQTYQGTTRTINLAFDLVSSNLKEAKANLDKSNMLISMMYPEYGAGGSATQLKSGPLFKVKMGNLICRPGLDIAGGATTSAQLDGLSCTISGFKYNPSIDDGFFDPAPGVFYPQTINIDFELTVIHEQDKENFIGWEKKGASGESTFRAKQDGGAYNSFPHAGELPDGDLPTARQDFPSELLEKLQKRQDVRDDIAEANQETAQTRVDAAGNVESGIIRTDRKPVEQGVRSALELKRDLMNERARIQANKLLSPKASQNLGAILNGDFLDIDIF